MYQSTPKNMNLKIYTVILNKLTAFYIIIYICDTFQTFNYFLSYFTYNHQFRLECSTKLLKTTV